MKRRKIVSQYKNPKTQINFQVPSGLAANTAVKDYGSLDNRMDIKPERHENCDRHPLLKITQETKSQIHPSELQLNALRVLIHQVGQ